MGQITLLADFGPDDTGLTTVGYALWNGDNTPFQARTTTGVSETRAGTGMYKVELDDSVFTDAFDGWVEWDNGRTNPDYRYEDLNFAAIVSARITVSRTGGAYATTEELALLLRVNETDRQEALQRVLDAAADEIDAELGLDEPYDEAPALVAQVNLERAVEHWKQQQSPFGLIGLPGEGVPAFASSDSWNRHAQKLSPLKVAWGIA